MNTIAKELPPGFFDAAPVADDRTSAWRYMREPGEVYRVGDMWFITSHAAVREAQKHPEVFSSARAFDAISGVVQLIPIRSTRRITLATVESSTRCCRQR